MYFYSILYVLLTAISAVKKKKNFFSSTGVDSLINYLTNGFLGNFLVTGIVLTVLHKLLCNSLSKSLNGFYFLCIFSCSTY